VGYAEIVNWSAKQGPCSAPMKSCAAKTPRASQGVPHTDGISQKYSLLVQRFAPFSRFIICDLSRLPKICGNVLCSGLNKIETIPY
jgi:hypothetical protein